MSRINLLRPIRSMPGRILIAVPAGLVALFFWMIAIGGLLDLSAPGWDADETRLLLIALAIACALTAAAVSLVWRARAGESDPIRPGVSGAPGRIANLGEQPRTETHHA